VIRLVPVICLLVVVPLLAQDSKDDIIKSLLVRMEALEREVASLKPGPSVIPTPPLKPVEPATAVQTKIPETEPEPHDDPRFTFHGYADAGFDRNRDGDSTKRFALGELDLFTTIRIAPKLNALVETVFETDDQLLNADVQVNIERLLLQYHRNDFFNVDIGSYRTAIGYYNRAILRGSWLQTSLSRPRMFAFEDNGGFLPLHNTGVSVNGKVPSGPLNLRYIAEIGNSRNFAQPGRTTVNFEHHAGYNLALYARPRSMPGLEVGASSYHDKFSPFETINLTRAVWTVHVVYQTNRIEFLNEGILTKFRDPANGYATIPAFYSQIAYNVRPDWKPYFRYEYINANGTGQEAVARQFLPWRTVALGGLRYDINDSMALKFELGRETSWLQSPWIRTAIQLAFTF
jgi:hypothetical protein